MKDVRTTKLFTILLAAVVMHAPSVQAGPLDCALPGLDDRCERWVRTHNAGSPTQAVLETPRTMAVAPDGTVYIAGSSTNATSAFATPHDFTVAAYAPDGTLRWADRFDGPRGEDDKIHAIALSPDGSRLFVVGVLDERTAGGGWTNAEFGTVAYDATTGTRLWVSTYDGADVDGPYGANRLNAVATSPDGSIVYVTGESLGGGTDWDYATFAYDAADGSERWRARYDRAKDIDRPIAIAATEDRVIVTGFSVGANGYDAVTIGYEAADEERLGEQAWLVRRDTGASEIPVGMTLAPDGGTAYVLLSEPQTTVVAYATGDGAQRWSRAWTVAGATTSPSQMAVSPDGGRVVVAGTITAPQQILLPRDMDMGAVALDASSGAPVWSARQGFPAATEEEGLALAVSGSRVYLSGYSSEVYFTYVPVITTVALDASNGSRTWVARHRRASATLDHDRPVAASLAPGGQRLYVFGAFNYRPTQGSTGGADLALLSYDTCEQVCTLEVPR